MAEDHRRVEARQIVGTGMATDAERITRIADDAARRERAWRSAPEVAFGDVLVKTPARAATDDDGSNEHPNPDAGGDPGTPTEPAPTPAATTTTNQPPPRAPLRPALRAPDPRARLLHARFAARSSTTPERG